MALFKRGRVWWYEFVFKGQRIQESTRQRNKDTARDMEASRRTALAKGLVGIEDIKPVRTLAEYADRFRSHIAARCAQTPAPVDFYYKKLARLLEYSPLRRARLDRVDLALIDSYIG